MLTRFKNYISQQSLFCQKQEGLLAISGGIDSVVMAHLFHVSGYPFAIAHCNFHLRPGDCDRDEAFVRSLAQTYGVPIYVRQCDTLTYAQQQGLSVEEAARNLRYEFFEQLRSEHHYHYIATAHHRDDSAETFFLNLLRGTGLAGLHGILPRNGYVVRPLLPFSRAEIEQYADLHGLAHVEDSTNSSLAYRRNQIRHQLMPLLREISPAVDDTMAQTISHLADAEILYRRAVEQELQKVVRHDQGQITIPLSSLSSLHPQRTLLFELLHPYGFTATVVDNLIALQPSPHYGQQFFSATHQLLRTSSHLLITPLLPPSSQTESYEISSSLQRPSLPIALRFSLLAPSQCTSLRVPPSEIMLDYQSVLFPLTLRRWRHSDRISPFGMRGTKPVSDLFTQHHLTPQQKANTWLLVDAAGTILWVIGLRASRYHAVQPSTTRILRIEVGSE